MAPVKHAWTPVHHFGHILVLLPLRRSQIYEGPQAVPTEDRSYLVQCPSSGSERSSRVGGKCLIGLFGTIYRNEDRFSLRAWKAAGESTTTTNVNQWITATTQWPFE